MKREERTHGNMESGTSDMRKAAVYSYVLQKAADMQERLLRIQKPKWKGKKSRACNNRRRRWTVLQREQRKYALCAFTPHKTRRRLRIH